MTTTARQSTATLRLKHQARWAHKREDCIATLREPKSVGYAARLHGVPETSVIRWRDEESIAAYTGPKLRMPEVGAKLA